MICDDVCDLVRETPGAHGIFAPRSEELIQTFCQVDSVTRAEFWRAQQAGIAPRWVLRLSEHADYHDEKLVIFRDKRWRVLRSYTKDQSVELVIGEATADAVPVPIPTEVGGNV